MKLKYIAPILACMISMIMAGSVLAADGPSLFKSKTCFGCHGRDAKTPLLKKYPSLAGQNADYAFNQMKDIKEGKRTNGDTAAMKGIMHLVSEEEMRIIADWLSTLK